MENYISEKKLLIENSKDNSDDEYENGWTSKFFGVCLSLCSALMLLALNTIVQYEQLHFYDVLLIGILFQTAFGLILLCVRGESVWIREVDVGKNIYKYRIMLLLYGLIGALDYASDIISVYFMPLGDAMTIMLSSVLPTMIFAAIFLNERLRFYKICCAILIITGLVLVIRPPFLFEKPNLHITEEGLKKDTKISTYQMNRGNISSYLQVGDSKFQYYYIGAFFALVCMLTSAIQRIMIKLLLQNKSTCPIAISMFYYNIANLLAALILPLFGGGQRIILPSADVENYNLRQWLGLLAIAVLDFGQFVTRFMSLKLVGPTVMGFIRTSEIIMAYIVQVTFLGSKAYMTALIGSGLVMIACIGVIFESSILKRLHPNIRPLF